MRSVVLVCLLPLLLGCGDDGLRDRSLLGAASPPGTVRLHQRSKKKRPSTAVIGLDDDPLAHYYADGSELVLRFEALGDLEREVADQLKAIGKALPELGLPKATAGALARRALGLPVDLEIDPLRPFAFVRVDGGWVGILPARAQKPDGDFIKALDAIYAVAGDPALVAKYKAGFSKGFYLPGHCSVIARPSVLPQLGKTLSEVAQRLDLDFGFLDGVLAPLPVDIERVDMSLRFRKASVRVDVRASPNPQSPTALALQQMTPRASAAVRWLPTDATFYFESLSPALAWEGLALNMLRGTLPQLRGEAERDRLALRRLLTALGENMAVTVDLEADGAGRAILVSHVKDPANAKSFFASDDLKRVLRMIGGADGRLKWSPQVFYARETPVATITGRIGRSRLLAWRQAKDPRLAALATLLRGPVVTYVAILDDKVCIVVGQRARREAEQLVEHLRTGMPADNSHTAEVTSLFAKRLAAASIDFGGLFEATREGGPYWHPRGRRLRDLLLPGPVPASAALTVEGGAIRLALRLRTVRLAEAIAAVRQRLR